MTCHVTNVCCAPSYLQHHCSGQWTMDMDSRTCRMDRGRVVQKRVSSEQLMMTMVPF